eukprot:1063477-Amphidinium_carterae.1
MTGQSSSLTSSTRLVLAEWHFDRCCNIHPAWFLKCRDPNTFWGRFGCNFGSRLFCFPGLFKAFAILCPKNAVVFQCCRQEKIVLSSASG